MVSMLLPVFSRRPIVGYPYVALATVMTGLVGDQRSANGQPKRGERPGIRAQARSTVGLLD
jgi:hypothetical protein